MSDVLYLAIAYQSSGEIHQMISRPDEIFPEGPFGGDSYVVHLYEDVPNEGAYIISHYVNTETGEIIDRGFPPNSFCYWSGSEWVTDIDSYLPNLRSARNQKLALTDWTQLTDAPFTEDEKIQIQAYRQALRDITIPVQENPENYLTEDSIPWPSPPSFLNIEI